MTGPVKNPKEGVNYRVDYTSHPVDIPSDFLKVQRADSKPITTQKIDFENTILPQYKGCYAVVLDNVLSPSECEDLIQLAEKSAGHGQEGVEHRGWVPALVNIGGGREALVSDYRKSTRIIWDEPEIASRLWDRCLLADGIREDLSTYEQKSYRKYFPGEIQWEVVSLNERLRFLRYGKGEFFDQHCDGAYHDGDTGEHTWYTLHLYLNDAVQAFTDEEDKKKVKPRVGDEKEGPLVGGATPFHSNHTDEQIDVDPKAGRVLIFQHEKLTHSGALVQSGVKYTVRSDVKYRRAE